MLQVLLLQRRARVSRSTLHMHAWRRVAGIRWVKALRGRLCVALLLLACASLFVLVHVQLDLLPEFRRRLW